MCDQKINGLDLEMARHRKCPIEGCGSDTYCVTTRNETETITKRYYTCTNLPDCGAQFVMIEHLSHFTYKPNKINPMEQIKNLVGAMNEEEKTAFWLEFENP